jgi:excisionase family DNA binding protein
MASLAEHWETTQRAELLDEAAAAAILGVTPGTLSVWRCTRRYDLPYVKVGRRVRYRASDLEAWLQSRTVGAVDSQN